METADVIVVGAGAAGVAAARALSDAGHRVIVLEARDRIGGRIHSLREANLGAALELGAEFVHGRAPETFRIAREAGLTLCNVTGEAWRSTSGRLRRQHDEWRSVDRVLARLDAERTPDRSFAEFIADRPGGRPLARARTLALDFIRGYHAADPERVSERSLAHAGVVGEMMSSTSIVIDGYDRIIDWMAAPLADALHFEAVVKRIEWKPGFVRVDVLAAGSGQTPRQVRYHARAAIIAVPHGVLRTGPTETAHIEFAPGLPAETRAAIDALEMGAVYRISLVFRERIWEDASLPGLPKGASLEHMSILRTREGAFDVWWTLFPLIERVIVGWCGGPPARVLAARGRAAIEEAAIRELAASLGIGTDGVVCALESCAHHDWASDPFSLGAYSYATPGGADAPMQLAQPIDATLFFAGEATDTECRTGTVEGAIASGRRAARDAHEAIRGVRRSE